MFDALKSLLAGRADTGRAPADPQHDLRVAACALLLEIAYADQEFSPAERQHIEEIVARQFALDANATQELIAAADRERRLATDLHRFTSVINQHYDEGQRMVLAELLWRIVYADGSLSQHEDTLIRKIANLLDLRPGYLSEARSRARQAP